MSATHTISGPVRLSFAEVCAARAALAMAIRGQWPIRQAGSVRQTIRGYIAASRSLKQWRIEA